MFNSASSDFATGVMHSEVSLLKENVSVNKKSCYLRTAVKYISIELSAVMSWLRTSVFPEEC